MRYPAKAAKYIFLITALLFYIAAPVTACEAGQNAAVAGVETEKLVIETQEGEKHNFHVEIAATPETIIKGLMFRSSMAEDHGMLFMFMREQERNFWMKNTLIPLDIVYIKEDGTINHIHENAVPLDETPLPSKGPVLNVLEINGGMAAKLGIEPGDKVYIDKSGK